MLAAVLLFLLQIIRNDCSRSSFKIYSLYLQDLWQPYSLDNRMDRLAELAKINSELSATDELVDSHTGFHIIKTGVDLKSRKLEIEKQLKEVETACISDYMRESDNITDLFHRVTCCDQILERLETILCKFQADLGNICQEIISLHEQTVSLNMQLKNKQAVRSKLGQFIEDMTIPEPVIHHIMYTPTCEKSFSDHLVILDQKIHFFKEQDFKDAMSCNDVKQTLFGLKTKAIFKVREYVLRKIHDCRKYLSNYQVPQNALLKNKFFYQFLLSHERERAREVQTEYIETMSKVYHSYFKEYIHRLCKLEYDEKPDDNDLMASDDQHNRNRANIIFNSKPSSLKNRSTVFTMGARSSVIKLDLEAPLIMPGAAKQDVKYTPEAIFRTVHYALLDNTCREFLFLKDFFMTSGEAQTADLFNSVFAKTLNQIHSHFNEQFKSSYDTIAIFLCLHLVYRYREMAKKKNVVVLDHYWDSIVKCLYPRFEKLVQMHISSVKNCDCDKFISVDTMPHSVTRKYAEFASAISSINETYPDERISILLNDLQNEVKNFILRTAAIFRQPREQQIFMINNYDHILSVFKRSSVREDSKDTEEIKLQLDKRIQEIVEELLYPHFGSIICFVKDCEVYLDRDDQESLRRNEIKLVSLIETFNSNWQKALDDISRDVLNCFSNFENGNNIQQAAMAQLLQYHLRFQKIMAHPILKDNPHRNKLINLHELMTNVKKYKTNF